MNIQRKSCGAQLACCINQSLGKRGKYKMSNTKEKEHTNDTKIAVLENTNIYIVESLNRVERRLDSMNGHFHNRFDKLDNRLWQLMLFTVAGFSGVLAIVAHGFKWF